jgi:hypothetical protein
LRSLKIQKKKPTNPTEIGAGKIPPGGSSRGASEAPKEEPRTEESTPGKIECNQNLVRKPIGEI